MIFVRNPLFRWLSFWLWCVLTTGHTIAQEHLADVHIHYSWDQQGVTTVQEAIEHLKKNNVVLAVVSSTPPELALELRDAGGKWIIPLFRPYLEPGTRHSWYRDKRVLHAAREALASGKYLGIGEFHLIAGLGPSKKNPILNGIIRLGIEFDVPILIHTETSSYRYFLPLCQQYPQARFLWAHAGGLLDAKNVGALLTGCSNVWVDFSARDPWRYIHSPIVGQDGYLLPEWDNLVKRYPQRFMIGSDPVWPVEYLHNWDEADTGWEHINAYLDFHRKWLTHLPAEIANAIRLTNAQHFFRTKGREAGNEN